MTPLVLHIRNLDTKATLQIVESGCTLYLNELPAHWTIEAVNPALTLGHSMQFYSRLDSLTEMAAWSAPYCPQNRSALVLSPGPHVLHYRLPTEEVQTFLFSVQASRPAAPIVSRLGTNLTGLDDPLNDPELHPELFEAMQATGFTEMRLWTTGTIGNPLSAQGLAIANKWLKILGGAEHLTLVINAQNSKNRCKAPGSTDLKTTMQSGPDGVIWEFINEPDFDVYYTDSDQAYADDLAVAHQVAQSKGSKLICANPLKSLDFLHRMQALGALSNCDAVGRHFYASNASQCLATVDALIAFSGTVGKPAHCTEGGVRLNDDAQAMIEIKALKAGLLKRSGTFHLFPLVNIPGDKNNPGDLLDRFAPLNVDRTKSKFYPAYL